MGLVAVAAGDAKGAEKRAKSAAVRIPGAPLAKLLSAQSRLLSGDAAAARRIFVELLEDDSATFFGLRGLLQESMDAKNWPEALGYIRKAYQLEPGPRVDRDHAL